MCHGESNNISFPKTLSAKTITSSDFYAIYYNGDAKRCTGGDKQTVEAALDEVNCEL